MFENLLNQPAADALQSDFVSSNLPPSALFSGPEFSGKLTAALELARGFSCERGAAWTCDCPSCARHKLLVHPDLLIAGPRACFTEIRAAGKSLLRSNAPAAAYLFVRAARKLLLRFSPVLWENEEQKVSKAAPLILSLNERLEELNPNNLPDSDEMEKIVQSVITDAEKLDDGFLPDSTPVSQVRRMAAWARMQPQGRKKTLIIENADRMTESARNAFLKILEEPPSSAQFILITAHRGAIMSTILSRVRVYAFRLRSAETQREVVKRIFRDDERGDCESLSDYFNSFLPVSSDEITNCAALFLRSVLNEAIDCGKRPSEALAQAVAQAESKSSAFSESRETSVSFIAAQMKRFEPRILFTLFLKAALEIARAALVSQSVSFREGKILGEWSGFVQSARESVTLYNQSPASALELLKEKMTESL